MDRQDVERRAALAALPALALVLLGAPPASAHTALSGSTPAAGTSGSAPQEVVLAFTGEVLARLSAVTVVGPDGADHAQGAPRVRGDTLVQAVDAPLPPGAWTVSYRVVAADGHPLTGQVPFTVQGPEATTAPAPARSATAPTAPAPTATDPAAAAPGPAPDAGGVPGVVLGLGVAGLGAAGLAAVLLARSRGTSRG